MTGLYDIRNGKDEDRALIQALYRAALPGEDLSALLSDLLADRDDVLSLVAVSGDDVLGHVAFTVCRIEGGDAELALLGPLAVLPAQQRRGIGTALIGEGLRRLREGGVARVLVLGDPNYYGRFGFATETAIVAPYPLVPAWRTAWQSLALRKNSTVIDGHLIVPPPWMRASLWSP